MSVSADDRLQDADKPALGARLSGVLRWFQATSAGRIAGLALLVAILAFLSVYPLSMLFYGSLHSTPPGMAGTFNLDGYRDKIGRAHV